MSTLTVARIPRVAFVPVAILLAGTLGGGPGFWREPDGSRGRSWRRSGTSLRPPGPGLPPPTVPPSRNRSARSTRVPCERPSCTPRRSLPRPPRPIQPAHDAARRALQQHQRPGPEPADRRAAGQHRRDRSEQLRRDGQPGDRRLRPQPQPDQQHGQRHLHGRPRELSVSDPQIQWDGQSGHWLYVGAGRGDRSQHAPLRLVQDVRTRAI